MPQSTQRAVEALCLRHQAVILAFTPEKLHLAMAETPDDALIEALRFATQSTLEVECWPQAQLEQFRQVEEPANKFTPENESGETAPEKIQALLQLAIQRRASDIHIEPQRDALRVRFRIDGVLQSVAGSEHHNVAALLARLKILANLDITERRIPQDGQFTTEIEGKSASFRLSTLPTQYGEKAVIRLLQSEPHAVALEKLGMPPAALKLYRQALARPQGLILVTGPTGSGKTFTLYSGLSSLNSPARNLCSVEDPIEIPLAGINQTQIHTKAGLDFNRVLRALLRQDPDVIMLGEIRDRETAETAIKAAQTGHLVLSTLHTNSTTETLTRMGQIGIPGYLLASALVLIIAQRLVRRLCPHCRKPGEAVAHFPSAIWPGTVQNWQAVGCERCYSGFYGRLALFEMLPVTARLQNAIAAESSAEHLTEIARQQGRNSLFVEGLHFVNRGDTTLEELNRIVGGDNA
ncbi:type II secretion system protein GspE [Erwinia sp. MMLR14_017]|uniref:type II secretion system protein GspE n=1 Tax=Erwinia sp. MMLR14_017 TaxID=3093842 RepID=UPI00298F72F4|nr:type II secretion system protein GspE [Erwinia sp. MMLR14_017]MDW8844757.1 type II secretion system protein GspE [Erwinia sp. MMLR14_017]